MTLKKVVGRIGMKIMVKLSSVFVSLINGKRIVVFAFTKFLYSCAAGRLPAPHRTVRSQFSHGENILLEE